MYGQWEREEGRGDGNGLLLLGGLKRLMEEQKLVGG